MKTIQFRMLPKAIQRDLSQIQEQITDIKAEVTRDEEIYMIRIAGGKIRKYSYVNVPPNEVSKWIIEFLDEKGGRYAEDRCISVLD